MDKFTRTVWKINAALTAVLVGMLVTLLIALWIF